MRADLTKKVVKAMTDLPLELQVSVIAALEVAGRNWNDEDTVAYGTIARDIVRGDGT